MKRTILSLLLAFTLVLGMMPLTSAAYTGTDQTETRDLKAIFSQNDAWRTNEGVSLTESGENSKWKHVKQAISVVGTGNTENEENGRPFSNTRKAIPDILGAPNADGKPSEGLIEKLKLDPYKEGSVPQITKGPEDAIVAYPAGAHFSVEVTGDSVTSPFEYQWILEDIEGNEVILEGATAKTNTLNIPATNHLDNDLYFYCIVKDKNGYWNCSSAAKLSKNNRYEIKPVLYVGEYAIEPGQSLDLSKKDIGNGKMLGRGIVSFNENGKDITIKNLYYDNNNTSGGLALAPNIGIDMEMVYPSKEEYNRYYKAYNEDKEYEDLFTEDEVFNVNFVGTNKIVNNFYDYENNGGGIPLDFYLIGAGKKPLVNFNGGKLEITNGYNAIRIIGDLMLNTDVSLSQTVKLFADGIVAQNLMVARGRKLDLEVYGSAIYSNAGNLFIDGADVTIDAHAPQISVGIAVKNIMMSRGMMLIKDADIDIKSDTDPEICKGGIAGYTGLNSSIDIGVYGSDISYKASVKPKEGSVYASDFAGMTANGDIKIEDSKLDIKIDSKNVFGAQGVFGLYSGRHTEIYGSKVDIRTATAGSPFAAAAEGDLNIDDSDVSLYAESYDIDGFTGFQCYGMVAGDAVFRSTNSRNRVDSYAKNGLALACSTGESASYNEVEYNESYKPQHLWLRDGTLCLSPAEGGMNLGNMVQKGVQNDYYIPVETYYDLSDKTKPADYVEFGIPKKSSGKASDAGSSTKVVDIVSSAEGSEAGENEGAEDEVYKDIPVYYQEALKEAEEKGITEPADGVKFEPMEPCTRAQLIVYLWRAAGRPEYEGAGEGFKDIVKGSECEKAALWAAENGVSNGTGEGEFLPEASCARADVLTMLWRAAGSPERTGIERFADVPSGSYYEKAVSWAVAEGITKGTGDGMFSPKAECTGAQMMTLLMRAGYFSE